MAKTRIPTDALVLVGDGEKALFLRNKGDAEYLNLVVEGIQAQDNPATSEQGTDRPGRTFSSDGRRSALEETDWHRFAEERFAEEIAQTLYRRAHRNDFKQLVVVVPPKVLGNLRKAFHKEVTDRIIAEVPKELTSHPVAEMEKLLAG